MAPGKKHDWEIIASRDAFFGVIVQDEFRAGRLTPEARQRFYATGEPDIAGVLAWFDADLGGRPQDRALDVGCGVGRLTRAMAGVTREVVGYDIAESMVAIAREGAPPNVAFTSRFPAGPFDWINSLIVFQHIPPKEGLALIDACLAAAAPRAFLSLQLTGWRDARLSPAPLPTRLLLRLQRMFHRKPGRPIDPLIRMYSYNFSDVLQRVMGQGFGRVVLHHTDHGGHHGAWLLARRG